MDEIYVLLVSVRKPFAEVDCVVVDLFEPVGGGFVCLFVAFYMMILNPVWFLLSGSSKRDGIHSSSKVIPLASTAAKIVNRS